MGWRLQRAAGSGAAAGAAGGSGAYAVRMAGEARGVMDEDERLVEKVERIFQHVATKDTHEGPAHASHSGASWITPSRGRHRQHHDAP